MLSLAPINAQEWAIGISGFIVTIAFGFLVFSRVSDRKGILMTYVVTAAMVWAWAGFFYGLTSNPAIAREWRTLTSVAVIYMVVSMVYFAATFLEDIRPLKRWERYVRDGFLIGSTVLAVWTIGDFFGQRSFVGELSGPSAETLAPAAGPFLWLIIFQNLFGAIVMGYPLVMRLILDPDKRSPGWRQARVYLLSFSLGTLSASTRWGPWYGIHTPPALGFLAVPLIIGGMFYLIKNYRLFNMQVLSTQLLIFAMWTFVFFRIILNPTTLEGALPDIFLLAGLIILGVMLMRSVINEFRNREAMEEVRREQAIDHAKTEFISIAAHQLRTPLAAIKWAFSVLLVGGNLTPEQHDLIEKGGKRVDALVDIVNDLLDVQTMSTGKFRYVLQENDLAAVVAEAAGAFDETARQKGLRLVVENPQRSLMAVFDRHKVGLAFQNLIDNAIKYTKEGEVHVSYAPEGSGIAITIADTGIGIPKEDQERIFQKFFRSAEAAKIFIDGSGLGLFIVKRIIEDQGGRIAVESTPGKGTRFILWLPRTAKIAASAP